MSHVVLGGGISGLSTAYYLSKSRGGIKLYEATNRVGGWINSFKTNKGTLFELGPRTLRHDGVLSENTLELCEDVGLTPLILPVKKTDFAYRNRFIYFKEQLAPVPTGFSSLFRIKPPFMRPLIFALWKDFTTPKKEMSDESVYDFISRRFGKDYAEVPCSALVCGIFGGDAREISVKAVMKAAFEQEQKFGSVLLGVFKSEKKKRKIREEFKEWGAWSFKNGLESLPLHLKKYLVESRKVDIFLEKKCTKITFQNGKAVLTIGDEEKVADHLYSALPSRELAKILGGEHSFLKKELSSIPFINMCVVNIEYEGDVIKNKGFGLLVPPNQKLSVLGVTFDSCIFPQEGKSILTVMMGGRWFEQYFGPNPDEQSLLEIAMDHVRKILKINENPSNTKVSVLRNCIPQYVVGHFKKVEGIREYIKSKNLPLSLIGNSFDGVGINETILNARNTVEKVTPFVQRINN